MLYGGYTVFNAGAYTFETPILGYYFVKMEYLSEMNSYFNEKITKLVEMIDDDLDGPNYSPPVEGEECSEDNVSTYCVAMGALDRYDAYVATLDNVMSFVGPTDGDIRLFLPLVGNSTSVPMIDELNPAQVLGITSARNEAIRVEKGEALRLMDMAIGAYNEFRTAYPMHQKYDEIIVALTKYREALEEIRVDASKMPPKFMDSTSSSCK